MNETKNCYTCKHIRDERNPPDGNLEKICIHPNKKHWLPCHEETNDMMTCNEWEK